MGDRNPSPNAGAADWSRWTPNQRRVIERLLGRDAGLNRVAPLPIFPPGLALGLRRMLEEGLAEVAERHTSKKPLAVNKHDLASVFKCEGLLLADEFEWSVPKLRGTAVAKAMALLSLSRFADVPPLDLAELVVGRMATGGDSIADFLAASSEIDRGELTLACADMLTKFGADWPPVDRRWGLRIETSSPVPLFDGRIVLKAKYDLAIGHPGSNPSDVAIVDFKSGAEYPEHMEEVRHYALLEALRTGVPPGKIGVHYLDAGYCRDRDVTEDDLLSALRRAVEGVRRIDDLWGGGRPPDLTPGTTCTYCPALPTCDAGQAWKAESDAEGRR